MRYTALILILLAGAANAETFKCQSGSLWFAKGKIVVVATINEDGATGTIKVAGVTHKAVYGVEGFNRRWDFGWAGDSHTYAFVIKADGMGVYYDFSKADEDGRASASQIFACK